MIFFLIHIILLVWVTYLWYSLEKRWNTIYISHDPTIRFWNHVYIPDGADASKGIQAAIDFGSNRRRGSITKLAAGIYNIEKSITLNRKVVLKGE